MKLFELITRKNFKPQTMKTPAADIHRQLIRQNREHGKELVGQGSFADTYSHEKDPGSVEKLAKPISPTRMLGSAQVAQSYSTKSALENDPYFQYLKLLSTNDRMSNNPYFPKVYDLKAFKGSDGRYTYTVNMERLQRFVKLSTDEIKMLGNNLFTTFQAEVQDTMKAFGVENVTDQEGYEEANEQIMHQMYATAFAGLLDRAIDRNSDPATYIKDKNLKQAVMLIRHLVKSKTKEEITNDLHVGNIMVRRGPFMPQVVITDPVS